MEKVKVLFVGIGGYAYTYINEVLDHPDDRIAVVGLVDPYPEACPRLSELTARDIPVFSDMEAFFRTHTADLAVITTPIHLHTRHILCALAHGANVLCEKPLCADEADIALLQKARDAAGKFVYIGYQWSWSEAILALKRDCMAGCFGAARELKTIVLWPRDRAYFTRGSGWAGRLRAADGSLLYDSVACNAAAHYLHNLFFVLGGDGTAAQPESVTAELLRANDIENFDTARICCTMPGGAAATFLAAHPVDQTLNPVFLYRFEHAAVCYAADDTPLTRSLLPEAYQEYGRITALFDNGEKRVYGNPFENSCRKFHLAVDAAARGLSGSGACGIEAAAVHTRVINEIQRSCPVRPVKPALLRCQDNLVSVDGLFDAMVETFRHPENSLLPFAAL